MLTVTVLWTGLVYASNDLQIMIYDNLWLYYLCLVVTLGISIGMTCHYQKVRKVPLNYILLSIYTVTHSYLIAAITAQYEMETVMLAAVSTWGMFISLTLYACFTKKDLTKLGGALCAATIALFIGIIFLAFVNIPIVRVAIIIIVIILMAVWLVHDTQLIVGGSHRKFQLEMDDYAIGALIIYSDILTIFIYLLQLFGGGD